MMSFYISGTAGSDFTPAPPGTHSAVCVDVIDMGEVETAYGIKHRARFVWEIDEDRDEGGRYLVFMSANVSMHENATMGALLRQWRGRDFTTEELARFDLDSIVGAPCLLSVVHNTKGANTYANVDSAVPLPKGMEKLQPSGDYTRQKDRDENSKDVRSDAYVEPEPKETVPMAPASSTGVAHDWADPADDALPF